MTGKFCDLYIETDMGRGSVSPEEAISFSEEIGTDTVAVCDRENRINDFQSYTESIKEVERTSEVRFLPGTVIDPENPRDMKNRVSELREKVMILGVEGGDPEINRAASEDPRIDFIADPGKGRKDCGIDHVIARKCSENRVFILERFRRLLKETGKKRVHGLKDIREHIRLSRKYGSEMVIASGAREKYEMRNPRDMAALAESLGAGRERSLKMVRENPGKMIRRAEKVFSDGYVNPGVEVVDDGS